jgi:hypothetical protein
VHSTASLVLVSVCRITVHKLPPVDSNGMPNGQCLLRAVAVGAELITAEALLTFDGDRLLHRMRLAMCVCALEYSADLVNLSTKQRFFNAFAKAFIRIAELPSVPTWIIRRLDALRDDMDVAKRAAKKSTWVDALDPQVHLDEVHVLSLMLATRRFVALHHASLTSHYCNLMSLVGASLFLTDDVFSCRDETKNLMTPCVLVCPLCPLGHICHSLSLRLSTLAIPRAWCLNQHPFTLALTLHHVCSC